MKATMEWNLPEDSEEHKIYLSAPNYHSAIFDIQNYIRSMEKSDTPDNVLKALDEVRQMLIDNDAYIY
jgi:hypothetical protein